MHTFDVVIVGAGHNGLVAACYLGMSGKRVLVLEKNDVPGGATLSKMAFPGVEARVSVYSYLISLLPRQILQDLGIRLEIRRRAIASYTPVERGGRQTGLLISNASEAVTRRSFADLTGGEAEYSGYRQLLSLVEIFARKVWPTLLGPLPSKAGLIQQFHTPEERAAWDYLVEKPLSCLIEDHLSDDTVRGAVFTDAKIGMATYPEDPSLLQNRTFLYHVIGQGTGEWSVPVGGMGALVDGLLAKARSHGVEVRSGAEVLGVDYGAERIGVQYQWQGLPQAVEAGCLLFNVPSNIANHLLPGTYAEEQVEGAAFKINMLLRRLPAMKDSRVSAREAFSGTLHLHEGYEQMKASYRQSLGDTFADPMPGEVYCHSLTDPSILSASLRDQGCHTLTLFGLDAPYHWFTGGSNAACEALQGAYLRSINDFIQGDIAADLALDAEGNPCIEARSAVDLEHSLGLPKGNIFHGNLTWPFADGQDAGTRGVETAYKNVYLCGSSAKRGGAVSGIPGYHAAMAVLER